MLIDLSAGYKYIDKRKRALSRLLPLTKQAGVDSVGELVTLQKIKPFNHLHVSEQEALPLTETSFFRDIYPFEALKKVVLPLLLKKRRSSQTLNIWCAACSSGQEPYSIALLLRQYFPIFSTWKLRLIASDISEEMLSRARAARYSQLEVSRGLPPTFLKRYFHPVGEEWQLNDDIREMVEFQQIDLTDEWLPLPSMDIIFMRNVLIYFDVPTKKAILEKVRGVLQPDGYLFLGIAETTVALDSLFKMVKFDKAVCYRLRG
ncbi:MAG: methyltransferase domain-containing protein [Oscillatoriaceae bacterium SKW80]|nr:methyltransferase domain-containing protein [Oscillatoriaceae bacterium SKYG93]MCX8119993.1 methyltransferase domain-containing protein [Oscillatoriaceae bacterium SKW80]MDW8454154.1 CheR family methyltransferase [Oscillatoriaceae cyanobacterium SKYGB_i_bin93]HIK27952.1 methyltransferase domain-containing protein [Oscillatoriaceae cyanobacterium M7585_C2015_266]